MFNSTQHGSFAKTEVGDIQTDNNSCRVDAKKWEFARGVVYTRSVRLEREKRPICDEFILHTRCSSTFLPRPYGNYPVYLTGVHGIKYDRIN